MRLERCTAWGATTVLGSSLCFAQVTQLTSVSTAGAAGNYASILPAVSADGRFVAFTSHASTLVPGDMNGLVDVFVRDRWSGTTERVSVSSAGAPANLDSYGNSISADGRYVAFRSEATNLVPGDTNGRDDVFVRDRVAGTTERVSVSTGGIQGNGRSALGLSSISADGRCVVFESLATNLVAGDTNGTYDVFVRDRQAGTTDRVSVSTAGAQGNQFSTGPAISADGRWVAFGSYASNLVPGDTNMFDDIFVRDRQSGTTERVSVSTAGAQANDYSSAASISGNGRCVAFQSFATNLAAGGFNGWRDVFVRDRQAGTTEYVNVSSTGLHANGESLYPSISADGRLVAFQSRGTFLVPGDTNGWIDIFVRDRQAGTTVRANVSSTGAQADSGSEYAAISADGRCLAFQSSATNLVAGDANGRVEDVFVREGAASGFTSLCEPGAVGVIACPCSNPPAGSGRGCDNSSGTGGASLSASGVAYVSGDSLVFTAGGEKPTALSILAQGNATAQPGVVFGQGVRCAGGSIERLYTKIAVGGSIRAPDTGAGDPTISARSAAAGDTIQPGQSRWYFVYYRDAAVLGGCPASSTFNATQTGRISWGP